MNNEAPKPDAAEIPALTQAPVTKRRWPALLTPATLIAVLALALLAWQWLETRSRISTLEQVLATRLTQGDTVAQEARTLAKQSHETIVAIQGKVGGLEAKLAESQSQLLSLDAMYQEIARNRDDRLLAEVDQTLTMGAQQLSLAGNVQAALSALETADGRLAASNRPQFLALRKAVARDMQKLKSLPMADVPGMALKLENIILAVDAMPMAFSAEPRPEAAKGTPAAKPGFWQELVRDVWNEMKQLVRVERLDRPDPGLLSTQHTFFLRENLKLRLLDARLALLQRDGKSFKEDMRQSRQWVERYFDVRSASAAAALASLDQLAKVDLTSEPPTLNESLTALRSLKAANEKGK